MRHAITSRPIHPIEAYEQDLNGFIRNEDRMSKMAPKRPMSGKTLFLASFAVGLVVFGALAGFMS